MGANIEVHKCGICRNPGEVRVKVLGNTMVCVTGCDIFQRGGFVVLNKGGEVSTCGIDKMEMRETTKLITNNAYNVR